MLGEQNYRATRSGKKNPYQLFKEFQLEYISCVARNSFYSGADKLYWQQEAIDKKYKIKDFQKKNGGVPSIFTNDVVKDHFIDLVLGKWGFPKLSYMKGQEDVQIKKDLAAYFANESFLLYKDDPDDESRRVQEVRVFSWRPETKEVRVITTKDIQLVRPMKHFHRPIFFNEI